MAFPPAFPHQDEVHGISPSISPWEGNMLLQELQRTILLGTHRLNFNSSILIGIISFSLMVLIFYPINNKRAPLLIYNAIQQ